MSGRGRVVIVPVAVTCGQRLFLGRWRDVQRLEVMVTECNGEVQRKRCEREHRAGPDPRSKPPHDARTVSERSSERYVML